VLEKRRVDQRQYAAEDPVDFFTPIRRVTWQQIDLPWKD
jgi:hypothetical protein